MSERYVALPSGKGFGVFDTYRDVWVRKNGPEDEMRESAAKYNAELETETNTAVDWLMAVRKYGIDRANKLFPEG